MGGGWGGGGRWWAALCLCRALVGAGGGAVPARELLRLVTMLGGPARGDRMG